MSASGQSGHGRKIASVANDPKAVLVVAVNLRCNIGLDAHSKKIMFMGVCPLLNLPQQAVSQSPDCDRAIIDRSGRLSPYARPLI
jgi:hypothetical protein